MQLPSPGITPDSPFYFVDIWSKRVGLVFVFGAEAKAKKALEYAEERLAEAQAKPAIGRAMATSVSGHEKAVEVLKTKGALPKGISDKESG